MQLLIFGFLSTTVEIRFIAAKKYTFFNDSLYIITLTEHNVKLFWKDFKFFLIFLKIFLQQKTAVFAYLYII